MRERARTPPQPATPASQRSRSTEAADLDAVGVSNNRKDGKATIYPDEPPTLALRSLLMAQATMVVRGLKVQAHIPSVNSPRDSRGQNSGARSHDGLTGAWVEVLDGTEHTAQPPGVVAYPNRPDLRQPNRPRMIVADADPVAAAWILLVAETKAVVIASFTLAFREANLAVPRWAYRASPRPRSTAASSNTWAETSFRQESPVTSLVAVPSGSTTNTRPALSLVFQRQIATPRSVGQVSWPAQPSGRARTGTSYAA